MTYQRGQSITPLGLPLAGIDLLVAGLVAVFCSLLWMNSAQLLIASASRDEARVLSCRYFTGTRVVERQYSRAAFEGGEASCPLIRLG